MSALSKTEVSRLLANAAIPMQLNRTPIAAGITEMLAQTVRHLDDPELMDMLSASVTDNVTMIVHLLTTDITLDRAQPPPMSIEYALRLAQRSIPSQSLRRAYHQGQARLVDILFTHIQGLTASPEDKLLVLHEGSTVLSEYFDWITQYVMQAYETEHERWLSTTSSVKARLVHQLLADTDSDATLLSKETGYDFTQHHIGIVTWVLEGGKLHRAANTALDKAIRDLARAVGSHNSPLVLPVDRLTSWAWLPRGIDSAPFDISLARIAASENPGIAFAIGLPRPGQLGFSQSHTQAVDAQRVVAHSTPTDGVIAYSDRAVGALAIMLKDIETTRNWVRAQLGRLAEDDETTDRLRETLRIYLENGGSFARTADQLMLHRNSIYYRVNRAIDKLGKPLGQNRLDVELALEACRRLGRAVLLSDAGQAPAPAPL